MEGPKLRKPQLVTVCGACACFVKGFAVSEFVAPATYGPKKSRCRIA